MWEKMLLVQLFVDNYPQDWAQTHRTFKKKTRIKALNRLRRAFEWVPLVSGWAPPCKIYIFLCLVAAYTRTVTMTL